MSLRSLKKVPQNRTQFTLGLLFRLFPSLVIVAFFWLWSGGDPDFARFAPFLVSIGVGTALGYAFAHGQSRFRRLQHISSSIGSWAFAIGLGFFLCWGALGFVFGGGQFGTIGEIVIVVLPPAFATILMFFGLTFPGEVKKQDSLNS